MVYMVCECPATCLYVPCNFHLFAVSTNEFKSSEVIDGLDKKVRIQGHGGTTLEKVFHLGMPLPLTDKSITVTEY